MLAQARKANPDSRVAESKLHEPEADQKRSDEQARLLYLNRLQLAHVAWAKVAGSVPGTVADKLRKALDRSFKVEVEPGAPLKEVLDYLADKAGGVTFRFAPNKER